MFITHHSFVARQPLHVDLPATGMELVNLADDTTDKVLARLVLVWVCKGSDNHLVVNKDN